ncbi:MAG: cysteine-rich CWC family protein [Pseudomonadota bacterium]
MPEHEHVRCPRCHKPFECKVGSILICHCSEVALTRDERAYIAERWDGCLCRECLLEVRQEMRQAREPRVEHVSI